MKAMLSQRVIFMSPFYQNKERLRTALIGGNHDPPVDTSPLSFIATQRLFRSVGIGVLIHITQVILYNTFMEKPIICFGQQPCGFFPKRFLYSKIQSAKKLQSSVGGRIVFFFHDSDADYRETITVLRDRQSRDEVRLNFLQPNKIQKKFSPLYAKRIAPGWKEEMLKQLPRFTDKPLIDLFAAVERKNVADFCLEMYKEMGLLEGIEIVRSGDRTVRERANDMEDFYADIEYRGEIVRALYQKDRFTLHEGGGRYIKLPVQPVEKWQKSPDRDRRFAWMQSVIHCTHYVMGASEKEYLDRKAFPDITFTKRDPIDHADYAWIGT